MFTEREKNLLAALLNAAINNTVDKRNIVPTFSVAQIDDVFSILEKLGRPLNSMLGLRLYQHGCTHPREPKVICKDCGADFNAMVYYDEAFDDAGDVVCIDCLARRHEMDASDVEYYKGISKYKEYERERIPL